MDKRKISPFIVVVVLVLTALFCVLFFVRDQDESEFVLQEPDRIQWMSDNGQEQFTYQKGDPYYQELYEAVSEVWKNALGKDGRIALVQLNHLEEAYSNGARVTFYYDKAILWHWPKEIEMHQYTFFESGYCALTEDGNYGISALVPQLEFSEKLTNLISSGK